MNEASQAILRIRRFFRDRRDSNRTAFARRAGLHRNSLYGMDEASWNPRAETLTKIIAAIEKIEAAERDKRRKSNPKGSPQRAAA